MSPPCDRPSTIDDSRTGTDLEGNQLQVRNSDRAANGTAVIGEGL